MFGAMQDVPLLVNRILDHALVNHPEREIVSRLVEGNIHRETYADAHLRSRKLSQALQALGFGQGDVLATLAWNTHRHFEAWYGITGIGGVYHTLNPRLFAEQLSYIINHAGDKVIFTDLTFVPILEGIEKEIPNVKGFIIMTDAAHMPETTLSNAHCYEDLIDGQSGDFNWVEVDERAPCGMCYTSGTTGNPKGVCYTHRSNVLHTLVGNSSDVMGLRSVDSLLPVVPLFHANAWGLAFGAPAVGAKIVNPGPNMDGESIYQLLTEEKVTFTAAVPTVWLMLMQHLETNKLDLPDLETVVIGGSAVPRVMLEKFERDYSVSVKHAWGMTEMSPLGTIASFKAGMENMTFDEQMDIKVKQGRPPYLMEIKITDDDGNELPRDGKAFGHLMVRGPFVVGEYIKGDGDRFLTKTGSSTPAMSPRLIHWASCRLPIAQKMSSSLAVNGFLQSRSKISRWVTKKFKRPPLSASPTRNGTNAHCWSLSRTRERKFPRKKSLVILEGKIAKWWMPDDVVFVDEIPHTATGKIQKLTLRQQFEDYKLPTAEAVAE